MNRVEEKYGLKFGHALALFIILILNVVWFVSDVVVFGSNLSFTIIVAFFELAGAVVYAVYGYKKPHGNHMRYLLLFYVLCVVVLLIQFANNQPVYVNTVYIVIIALVSYMAGRLDHYKQNLVICGLVTICNCVVSYYLLDMIFEFGIPQTFVNIVSCLGCVTVWLAIAAGYITRFKVHKEAGLQDK